MFKNKNTKQSAVRLSFLEKATKIIHYNIKEGKVLLVTTIDKDHK